jgi:ribonuclease Z
LVSRDGQHLLFDCGRGVVMRLAAAGVGPAQLHAVWLTHLHSDHICDLSDVITTRWITTFTPTPLDVVGPPGTAAYVDAVLASLAADIGYRIAHHDDLDDPPMVRVHEICAAADAMVITAIRDDVVRSIGLPRLDDICGYHSSLDAAAHTAAAAGVATLVITHHVPAPGPGDADVITDRIADHFGGAVVVANDLDRIDI